MIRKLLMTAAGAGIVYLMKNKTARDNLIQKAQSFSKRINHPQQN